MHDFQHATAEAAMDLLNDLKAGGYKIVFMQPKYSVTTIASYDEAILKQLKGSMADTRHDQRVDFDRASGRNACYGTNIIGVSRGDQISNFAAPRWRTRLPTRAFSQHEPGLSQQKIDATSSHQRRSHAVHRLRCENLHTGTAKESGAAYPMATCGRTLGLSVGRLNSRCCTTAS